mgnify:FL=1
MKKNLFIMFFSVVSLFAYEEITKENFSEKISGKNAIVKFHATWCPNCRALEKNFNKVDLDALGVTVYKVDIEQQRELTQMYSIRALPSILYLKNGKLISTEMGVKTPNEISESIDERFN